jgi:hypothetical protein
MGFLERRTRSENRLVSQTAVVARRGQSRELVRLSPLTSELGSGRLCGLRIGEQHLDKLAQRTAGVMSSFEEGLRVRASCAEDGASGWMLVRGVGFRVQPERPGSIRLVQQQESQPDVRGHHTQRRRTASHSRSDRCDSSESTGPSDGSGRFGVRDASASHWWRV